MEALHNLVQGFDEELEFSGIGRKISERRQEELLAKFQIGENEIYKQIDVGKFLLFEETVERLQALLRALDLAEAETDFAAHHDRASKAIHSCIEHISSLAQKELRPASLWRRR
jgi:hypothetical protein